MTPRGPSAPPGAGTAGQDKREKPVKDLRRPKGAARPTVGAGRHPGGAPLAKPILTFIHEHLSTGSILAEAFYGIWMVVVVTSTIRAVDQPTADTVRVMMGAALGVNIAWGIIDGLTVMWANMVDRTKELELVNSLRTDHGDRALRDRVDRALRGTIVGNLSMEQRTRVVEMLEGGQPMEEVRVRSGREDYEAAVATALINFVLIFPVTLPYILFMNDLTLAMRTSQVIALLLFAGLGYAYARNAKWNKLVTPIVFALAMLIVIIVTFELGW